MKLYLKPGACSLSVHIALCEAGLPFETDTVDLKSKVTATGKNFLDVTPKGYVPALELDDGEVLTEAPAILQYVADLAPNSRLAPPPTDRARYRLQAWLNFISGELHKPCGAFFNPAAPAAWRDLSRENLLRRLAYTEQALNGRPYLLGDDFSVADAYLFVVLGWLTYLSLDLATWPNLKAFHARVAARPAVVAALQAEEGLV